MHFARNILGHIPRHMVERLNEEIRRRERVIRIFPNEESAHRLLGAVLAEIHEKLAAAHKYLSTDEYYQYKEQLRHARPKTKLRMTAYSLVYAG